MQISLLDFHGWLIHKYLIILNIFCEESGSVCMGNLVIMRTETVQNVN